MTLLDDATALLPDLVTLRRALHADPEVGLDLPRTQRRVLDALAPLGVETTVGAGLSSVVGVLRGGRPGPTVLLRGDMDALPVQEASGEPFASGNGAMHACGHDLHVAGLVGAARLLAARRDDLAGDVLLMFQPGEEGDGGARIMLDEGLLDATGQRPVGAYAVHVEPGDPGVLTTRPGTIMAGAGDLQVVVTGRGGHGSSPHRSVDPVAPLLEIGQALATMVTRRFSVFDPVVVTVTQLSAGTAVNVIPDTARLGATVRTLSAAAAATMTDETARLSHGIAAAHGCTAEVRLTHYYPPTINDAAETEKAIGVLRELLGEDRVAVRDEPLMGSEDFSFVLEQVPGCFLFLGATPADVPEGYAETNHSARVRFDDGVLAVQSAALAELALARLAG